MKTSFISIGISLLLALTAHAQSGPAPGTQARNNGRERIGIYDSRAVAVAYAGSAFQEAKMNEMKSRLRKAREAGDAREAARIEAEGQAWQKQLHRQGFGTDPVDDLLTHIAGDLPKIRDAARVTTLVSKWNKVELDKHPKADRIDVTTPLVDAFHPTAQQRQHAREIQKKSPVNVKE